MRDIVAGCLIRIGHSSVTKTGYLRIPVFACRLGHFEKIDLGTDFEKTAPNTLLFRALSLGFPLDLPLWEGPLSYTLEEALTLR